VHDTVMLSFHFMLYLMICNLDTSIW